MLQASLGSNLERERDTVVTNRVVLQPVRHNPKPTKRKPWRSHHYAVDHRSIERSIGCSMPRLYV